MSNLQNCPNCGAKLKGGVFNDNYLINEDKNKIVNLYSSDPKPHCYKCYSKPYNESLEKAKKEIDDLKTFILDNLHVIPVVTAHSPFNWEYRTIGMVTAQSSTGTGVITEFTSSFTDFFGMQSKKHSTKIKKGEDLCLAQLRADALAMHANAIIATDIDYSEIGSGKGILMVCMAGTAVSLSKLSEHFLTESETIDKLHKSHFRLSILKDLID